MAKKVEISLEEIREIYKRRAEINDLLFSEIVWTENGEPIEISPATAKNFEFSGFGNFDFVKYFWDEPERISTILITKKEREDD